MDTSIMHAVDPFSHTSGGLFSQLVNAISATALIRCWPLLVFFTAWATAISVISHKVHNLGIQSTLLTVIGTVLGFVVSYRTTSSFERYNEGRRLWSQIVLASRTFSRTVWFHVPEVMPPAADEKLTLEQRKQRVVIEKKTVINLVEAFAVAVKHYLRGEDGVYYVDLYHLVKFLPTYALPAALPSSMDVSDISSAQSPRSAEDERSRRLSDVRSLRSVAVAPSPRSPVGTSMGQLPLPVTSPKKRAMFANGLPKPSIDIELADNEERGEKSSMTVMVDDGFLLPAHNPPKYHLLDLFPLSLIVHPLAKRGKDVKGKTAARIRAKLRSQTVSHNLPLEISFYLSSYIAALQNRKVIDAPTSTALLNSLGQLADALTGLERILTTPIPFSYRVHLWTVTLLYNLLLIWNYFGWLTIPATTLLSFIFFGFLVAGEEIENPFGYDKNDLNMDHFTHNIIRSELRALTALPVPDPSVWAFSPSNDQIFGSQAGGERVSPEEWLRRGFGSMQVALAEAI